MVKWMGVIIQYNKKKNTDKKKSHYKDLTPKVDKFLNTLIT